MRYPRQANTFYFVYCRHSLVSVRLHLSIITGVAVPHLTLLGVIATPFIPAGLLISNIDWALNPFGSFEYFLGFATLVSTATILLAPLCIQFDILGKVYNQLKRIKKWIATGK